MNGLASISRVIWRAEIAGFQILYLLRTVIEFNINHQE